MGLLARSFLWVAILAANASAAGSCPTRDLAEGPDSPIWKIPAHDQDGTGTCYAHAAAFMIDFARAKKGETLTGDFTDPIYLAWVDQYQNAWAKSRSLDGGFTSQAVNSAIAEGGVCKQADVNAAFAKIRSGMNLSHAQLVHLLDVLDEAGWKAQFTPAQSKSLSSWGVSCPQSQSVLEQVAQSAADGVGKGCAVVLRELFKDCQQRRRKLELPEMEGFSVGTDQKMKSEMDRMLDEGLPAGVSLCANVLYRGSARGLRGSTSIFPRGMTWNIKEEACGGLHAVAAIGRKEIHGRCSYLLRNSWGAMNRTSAAQTCACKVRDASGAMVYQADCPRGTRNVVEVVGCWYAADDLLPNITEIEGFESESEE